MKRGLRKRIGTEHSNVLTSREENLVGNEFIHCDKYYTRVKN